MGFRNASRAIYLCRSTLLATLVACLVAAPATTEAQRGRAATSQSRRVRPDRVRATRQPVRRTTARTQLGQARGGRIADQLREGKRIEPHLHFEGTVRGGRLLNLAEREGNLAAGLEALGLSNRPQDRAEAKREASRMLDISRNPIDVVYPALSKFRDAAFGTPRAYAAWLRTSFEVMNRQADITYVQIRPERLTKVLDAVRDHGLNLGGVRFLLGIHRTRGLTTEQRERVIQLLRDHPQHAVGVDLLGEETTPQDPDQIRELLALLDAAGHPSRILRLHEGEGVDNPQSREAVRDNVNVALRSLRRAFRGNGADRSTQVILGHATHVRNLQQARRDMQRLKRMGVDVFLNPNPLANMMWGSVSDPMQINARELQNGSVLVGTDNVGSLQSNIETWRRIENGDRPWLNQRLRGFRRIAETRQANPQEGTSAPPPEVEAD